MRQRYGRNTRMGIAVAALLLLLAHGATALAQEAAPPRHVRGEDGLQRLIDEAAYRSPAIRHWIDRLQEFDVTVYVRARTFAQSDLVGRVALLSTVGRHRYLVI